MKTISFGESGVSASVLCLGCMRMGDRSVEDAAAVVRAALDAGIDLFDHADIYHGGKSEEVFAAALERLGVARDAVVVQSKCGIRDGYFDFSREHIEASVEGSLRRLRTDRLDLLLLHRPDALVEPEEVAAAFDALHAAGKVRAFGVSNQNPAQLALLRAAVRQPLVANQVQLGLGHTVMIDHGFNVNMDGAAGVVRDGGVLEDARLHGMVVQAWSPLQVGFFGGVFLGHPEHGPLNVVLNRIAAEQGGDPAAVAVAWLLRHPAVMQPILGSMNPQRVTAMARAVELTLTRPQWYELYRAAGHRLP
jgi:predicted oxidoreductase